MGMWDRKSGHLDVEKGFVQLSAGDKVYNMGDKQTEGDTVEQHRDPVLKFGEPTLIDLPFPDASVLRASVDENIQGVRINPIVGTSLDGDEFDTVKPNARRGVAAQYQWVSQNTDEYKQLYDEYKQLYDEFEAVGLLDKSLTPEQVRERAFKSNNTIVQTCYGCPKSTPIHVSESTLKRMDSDYIPYVDADISRLFPSESDIIRNVELLSYSDIIRMSFIDLKEKSIDGVVSSEDIFEARKHALIVYNESYVEAHHNVCKEIYSEREAKIKEEYNNGDDVSFVDSIIQSHSDRWKQAYAKFGDIQQNSGMNDVEDEKQ